MSLIPSDTVKAKHLFERFSETYRVSVKYYGGENVVSKLTVWDENVGFIDRLRQFQDFDTSSVSEQVIITISVLHEPC